MIEIRAETVTAAHRAEVAAGFDATEAQRAKTDTSGGMVDAVDCLNGACFFRVIADGEPVAFYVLKLRRRGARCTAEVTLAHGRAGFDLVAHVLPLIEQQCTRHGVDALRIETRRVGLMKKIERAGYTRASAIYTKELR